MRAPIPGPVRHATRADTTPNDGEEGGTWIVACMKPECAFVASGEYNHNGSEEWALRLAHAEGTVHERQAEAQDTAQRRAQR